MLNQNEFGVEISWMKFNEIQWNSMKLSKLVGITWSLIMFNNLMLITFLML